MIIQKYQGKLLVVTQPDHGDLAGQFAAHWGNSQFQEPAPLEDMIIAATAHDNGWWEQDNRPTVDLSSQSPYDFSTLPYTDHVSLYRRGINRSIDDNPYTGLMVCMHGVGLYKQRYGTDPSLVREPRNAEERDSVQDLIQEQEQAQEKLRGQLNQHPQYSSLASDQYIWTNYKLLQIWDRLSLLLCLRGAAEFTLSPAPTSYNDPETSLAVTPLSENELSVAPYPFRDPAIDFHVRARIMPDQPYGDVQRFREAYYRAQRFDLTYILRSP